tara:strand:- start:49 stop:420 length:372 start_codon:yes stop_codon:yes gene_type:complete
MKSLQSNYKHNKIKSILISELGYSSTDSSLVSSIKESIPKEGLHYPISAYFYNPKVKWEDLDGVWLRARIRNASVLYPDKRIIVWQGNNRIQAAKELGYTSIDCVVYSLNNQQELEQIQKGFT